MHIDMLKEFGFNYFGLNPNCSFSYYQSFCSQQKNHSILNKNFSVLAKNHFVQHPFLEQKCPLPNIRVFIHLFSGVVASIPLYYILFNRIVCLDLILSMIMKCLRSCFATTHILCKWEWKRRRGLVFIGLGKDLHSFVKAVECLKYLQLSRVKVHSVTPNWKPSDDLGPTKIRDTVRGQILLFKEFDWQTTRIEATAVEGESSEAFLTTPLRFIANQSKIRITIKKRLSGNVVLLLRMGFFSVSVSVSQIRMISNTPLCWSESLVLVIYPCKWF